MVLPVVMPRVTCVFLGVLAVSRPFGEVGPGWRIVYGNPRN